MCSPSLLLHALLLLLLLLLLCKCVCVCVCVRACVWMQVNLCLCLCLHGCLTVAVVVLVVLLVPVSVTQVAHVDVQMLCCVPVSMPRMSTCACPFAHAFACPPAPVLVYTRRFVSRRTVRRRCPEWDASVFAWPTSQRTVLARLQKSK